MFDTLRIVALAGTLAVTLGASTPARAQAPEGQRVTVAPPIDSLFRQVHALDSALIVRSRVVDSLQRRLARAVPPVDVRRGALHVRTVSDLEPRVRPAVDSVAALIERRGGPVLEARVVAHVPTVVRDSTRSVFGVLPVIAFAPDTLRRWSTVGRRPTAATASSAQIADALTGLVEQFALQGVDSALAAWVMVGRVPLRDMSEDELADAYIEMATVESAALRRCQSGDMESCLDALGIDSLRGPRLTRWYAPEDYRALLRSVAPPREDSVAVAAWIRCREDRDASACTTAASALTATNVPPPLSATARVGFLQEVLRAGGRDAYARLVSSSGSVRERLELAAGEPIDRTVLRWRERVEQARPDRMRAGADLVIASLGWTTALLGLTLFRRGSWA